MRFLNWSKKKTAGTRSNQSSRRKSAGISENHNQTLSDRPDVGLTRLAVDAITIVYLASKSPIDQLVTILNSLTNGETKVSSSSHDKIHSQVLICQNANRPDLRIYYIPPFNSIL